VGSQEKYEGAFRALGIRLKALRQKAGYSQEDMLTFGFSTRHWQQVESGRPVTLTTVLRACDVFRIQPDELMKGLNTPQVTQTSENANVLPVRRRKPHGKL
jgi:transcriptional regulator with XRE-family HTH domain